MNLLAEKIIDYFIENGITSKDMKAEKIYGLEVIFGKVLNYTTLIILSLCNKNFLPTIFFMVAFFSLRGRIGGFQYVKKN